MLTVSFKYKQSHSWEIPNKTPLEGSMLEAKKGQQVVAYNTTMGAYNSQQSWQQALALFAAMNRQTFRHNGPANRLFWFGSPMFWLKESHGCFGWVWKCSGCLSKGTSASLVVCFDFSGSRPIWPRPLFEEGDPLFGWL